MADDEDAIYIDVVPRVDDAAADSAVGKLKDKFKDVAGEIGPEFMDALSGSGIAEEFGKKLGDALSGPLKDLSEGVGLDLKNPLEKMLKQDMSGALDDVATQLGTKLAKAVSDPLHNVASNVGIDLDTAVSKALNKDWGGLASDLGKGLGGKLTDVLGINEVLGINGIDGVVDKVHTLSDAVKSLRGGDLGGALQGANALTGGALQPLSDLHDQVKQTVGDTTDLIEETVGSGWLGSKAKGKAATVAEGAAPVAASLALTGPVEDLLNKIPWVKENTPLPGSGGDWFKSPFRQIGGDIMHPSRIGKDHQYDSNGNFIGDGKPAVPQENSTDRLYNSVFPGGGGGGATSTTANEVDVKASSAIVSAGSVTLGGNISLPSSLTSGGGSSASPSRLSSSPIGGLGSESNSTASLYSGSSILGKGFSTGGILPGDSPGHDNMVGVLPNGMVGLEGGEGVVKPSAMSAPGVASLITQLNKGYDEGTSSPAGVGGDSNNPSLSTPPTQGNTAGGGQGIQQQQLGTGQGGGISGGGIIGAAEQAGVAAAGVAGFGGGAIAAQMAVQETNLAVQKASQSAAALATAPFETFGLAGGMMGAPKVNPMGGWIGKLIAGELGSQTNLPNLAGASTQPPKKPDQKQPGDDQQGQGESPSGPSGAKDDPMHVNVTNQPSPQQGSATSAMNATPGLTMSVP